MIANEPTSKGKTKFADFCMAWKWNQLQIAYFLNIPSLIHYFLLLYPADNGDALKRLGIGIVLLAFMPFTAINILQSYAVNTFQRVGTSIDSYTSTIALAVALICGSLTSTYLADILGRRTLNLVSLFGAASGLFGTALYHYLSLNDYDLTSYAWIPVVCLCFVIFISSAGINSLAAVCCVENLPTNVSFSWSHFTSGSAIQKIKTITLET